MTGRLVRGGTWLLRFLPMRVALAIALGVADLAWVFLRQRRRTIEGNLRHTAPDRTAAEHRRLARETFRNLARCTVDFLRIPLMGASEVAALFDERGFEHLDAALARGGGAIVVSAHVGNYELAPVLFAARGYQVHVVAEDTAISADEYQTYGRYRSAAGATQIPLSGGGLRGYRALRQGGVLGLVGDRLLSGRGEVVDFCGGYRELPIGPAALARQTGAPLLSAYFALNPAGSPRYLSVVEPQIDVDPGASDDLAVTRAVADRLTGIVKAYPDQWFVFQPRWMAGVRRDGVLGCSDFREASRQ